jgi:small conductance mechanosensitive channel
VVGILLAADALGFDPNTVVTGLGLTGLVLGFALKDILSNFVSGILILTLRSFRLGDQIVVGDTEGNVERIELRATQIRTYDGRAVIVPNAELLTSRIVNNTAATVRRGSVELGLDYKADLHRSRETMFAAMRSVSGVLEEPPPSVRIRELSSEAIIMEARFWTDSRRSDFLATQSAVAEAIVNCFRSAGLPLPEPAERLLAPIQVDSWRAVLGRSDGEAPT